MRVRALMLPYCLFPAPSTAQKDRKRRVPLGEVVLRLSIVVIVSALAGSLGSAAAQYYPPAPVPGYPPPPPSYPYPPQPYEQAPMPGPYGDALVVAPAYGPPPAVYRDANGTLYDPRYGEPPVVDGSLIPQPVPTIDGQPIPRPPTDIGSVDQEDITGSVRAPGASPAAGPYRPVAVTALPPEDQPEQGPAKELPAQFRRQIVDYQTIEPAGTIIIDTPHTYLYLILGNGQALRYGIGVGREGFTWSGTQRIARMKEWPDWFPPKEMIERQPYLPRFMAGGDTNPLGARALYLGNTLYRIHGTNQPSTIGTFVSSGCIRLTNEDVEDLYSRVSVGTRVEVLPGTLPDTASAQGPISR
jgi:lipoprotein-anchoring transpeptidase ErfK/SrfK